ncbi:MAG: T9SS type A sorting domain-containing protein [Candidatus Aenigmarchaeota archaeon]|nr:T9SS type A sorting domain-containing protein [Candidatus Aenigmarchaeota archaeon]
MKTAVIFITASLLSFADAHSQGTLVFENRVRASGGDVTDSLLYQVYVSRLPVPVNQEFSITLRILSRGVYNGSRRIIQTDAGIPGINTEISLVVPDDKIDIRNLRTMNFYNMNSGGWRNVPVPDVTYQMAERIVWPTLSFVLGFIPGIGSSIGLAQGIASASFELNSIRTYSAQERERLLRFESEFDVFPIPLDPIPEDGWDYRNLHLGGYEFVLPMSARATGTTVNLLVGRVRTQPRNIVIGDEAVFPAQNISVRLDRLRAISSRGPVTAPGTGVVEISGSLGSGDPVVGGEYGNRLWEWVRANLTERGIYTFRITSSSGKISVFSIKRWEGYQGQGVSEWTRVSGVDMKWKEGSLDTNVLGTGYYIFSVVADEPGVSGDYRFTLTSPNSSLPELIISHKPVGMPMDAENIPQTTQLSPNFPNPFNSETTVSFAIGSGDEGHVKLAVYNMLGQEVAVLVDEPLPAGNYTAKWDGRDGSGRRVASGIYLYRLEAGKSVKMEKMLTLQ